MLGVKQSINSTSPYNSSKSVLEGAESQENNKRGRAPDDDDSTEKDWANPSPHRSARLSCRAKQLEIDGIDPFTHPTLSAMRRVKKQKTQTSANQDDEAPTHSLPTASPQILPSHVHSPRHSNLSSSTSITTTHIPVASFLVGNEPNSFWNKKIDLYLSESVKKQTILSTEVPAIHKASLVLLNALAKGSCTQFDPDELLSHPVTFSSSGEPRIREWCQRAESDLPLVGT